METCITLAAILIALSIYGLALMVRACLENLTYQVKIIREDMKMQRSLRSEIEKEVERISTPIRRYQHSVGEGVAAATDHRSECVSPGSENTSRSSSSAGPFSSNYMTPSISGTPGTAGQFSAYRDPSSGPDGSIPFNDSPEAGNQ